MSADSSSQPEESEQRVPRLGSEQPADFSSEGKESVQCYAPNNLTKAHLILRSASSRAAKSMFQSILIMDVPSQETSNQWWGQSPLGAENTTDSLSDDAGSQISVNTYAAVTHLTARSSRNLLEEVYVN